MPPRKATLRVIPLAAVLAALLLPAAASAGPVTIDVDQSAAAVRDYWTKARMRHADPVPVPVEPAGAAPSPAPAESGAPTYVPPAGGGARLFRGTASGSGSGSRVATPVLDPAAKGVRAHGKVFFTVRGGSAAGDYVCSGTAINSRKRNVVWTAGHCVYDAEDGGGRSINFAFAPAYNAHDAPYGLWPAKTLATTRQWKRDTNLRYDLGAAVVRRRGGRQLQSVVGARGIGFNQPRDQDFAIFGYPATLPFTGEIEYSCASSNRGSDSPGVGGPNTVRASCDMTAGSSGGGWIAGRTLLSVTSYGYPTEPGILYGPYLGRAAKKLYKRVRGKRPRGKR